MGFLSWIKKPNAGMQQSAANKSQEPTPENAKQMYTREAAQERANHVAPTLDQQERARRIGEEMRKATQHLEQQVSAPTNAPGADGGNSAEVQKQHHQNKAQEALSPTDGATGKTAMKETQPVEEKPTQRAPQTVPRRPPSWER